MKKILFLGSVLSAVLFTQQASAQMFYPASPNMYGYGYNYGNSGFSQNYNTNNSVGNGMTPWAWGAQNLNQGVTSPVSSMVTGNNMRSADQNQSGNNSNNDKNGGNDSSGKSSDKNNSDSQIPGLKGLEKDKKDKDKEKTEQSQTPAEQNYNIGIVIKGKATVINPLTFRVNGQVVVLGGLMSPFSDSMCHGKGGIQWPCGKEAENAAKEIINGNKLECSTISSGNIPFVSCNIEGEDLGNRLVETGFYIPKDSKYGNALSVAKSDHRGIW